ncbi:MAG: hypothetical protein ACK5NA_01380 [Enterococcus sp.]
MKIFRKAIVCGLTLVTIGGLATPVTSVFAAESEPSSYNTDNQSVYFDSLDDMSKFVTDNNLQPKVDFSKYFYVDSNDSIQMNINSAELKSQYNLTDKDISDLQILNTQIKYTDESKLRGFVGLHINLGSKVRGMSAVVAGGFAAGYCSFYLKQFAINPVTAGVVEGISAAIGGTVDWAVNQGMKRVDVGVNVPFVSLAFTVNVP